MSSGGNSGGGSGQNQANSAQTGSGPAAATAHAKLSTTERVNKSKFFSVSPPFSLLYLCVPFFAFFRSNAFALAAVALVGLWRVCTTGFWWDVSHTIGVVVIGGEGDFSGLRCRGCRGPSVNTPPPPFEASEAKDIVLKLMRFFSFC